MKGKVRHLLVQHNLFIYIYFIIEFDDYKETIPKEALKILNLYTLASILSDIFNCNFSIFRVLQIVNRFIFPFFIFFFA